MCQHRDLYSFNTPISPLLKDINENVASELIKIISVHLRSLMELETILGRDPGRLWKA